jgi:hypothetical protein
MFRNSAAEQQGLIMLATGSEQYFIISPTKHHSERIFQIVCTSSLFFSEQTVKEELKERSPNDKRNLA